MMTISIVLPNYNGLSLLKENLPKLCSLIKKSTYTIELVVTDDGSKDASVTFLQEYKKKEQLSFLTILTSEKNHGFSTNVDNGVKAAKGELVFLLNSDAMPGEGFLEPLVKHFNNERVFAVGCMDKSVEADGIVHRGRGVGRFYRGFLLHIAGSLDKTNTLWASGGSSMFRKSYWEKFGGLYTIYDPFYWEDIDLSYRGWKAGYSVLFEPKSTLIHEHDKGAIKNSRSASAIKSIAYRNQFLFVWINITDLDLIVNHLLWLPYHLSNALLKRDFIFLKGFLQALLRLSKALQLRAKNRAFFTVSDREVLAKFHHENAA